jgi:hypothetical protein
MRLLTKFTSTKKLERQFKPECDAWANADCDNPATWAAWSAHGTGHEECFCFCCDGCREVALERWKRYEGKTCVCGYAVDGTIDQHLRFIRL